MNCGETVDSGVMASSKYREYIVGVLSLDILLKEVLYYDMIELGVLRIYIYIYIYMEGMGYDGSVMLKE